MQILRMNKYMCVVHLFYTLVQAWFYATRIFCFCTRVLFKLVLLIYEIILFITWLCNKPADYINKYNTKQNQT